MFVLRYVQCYVWCYVMLFDLFRIEVISKLILQFPFLYFSNRFLQIKSYMNQTAIHVVMIWVNLWLGK